MAFNRVRPLTSSSDANSNNIHDSNISNNNDNNNVDSADSASANGLGLHEGSIHSSSFKNMTDMDSMSAVNLEESSYLKLRPFTRLDPTLMRLIKFLGCFGLLINLNTRNYSARLTEAQRADEQSARKKYSRWARVLLTLLVAFITGEVVYDVNLRQSKLLLEQKRSTPLLTFVIVAYSWLTLVIPIVCDISLMLIGPHLFRFYSRTTSTVCNGMFFGKKTSVDSWYYYLLLVLIAFLDVIGQVVLLGVWPASIDPYMRVILFQDAKTSIGGRADNLTDLEAARNSTMATDLMAGDAQVPAAMAGARINANLLDFLLGENYAHGDLGVSIKIVCLVVQFVHSYAFLIIIISLANHYATAITSINDNLDKYEFRRLLTQLIILRDSSEQISLMISIPFSLIIMLVFMRQIALNGVFIQSTMQPFENWAVSLQSFTCSVSIFMVFIYCDGLQSASKQTHRLKTEQTVINENRGGNQSIYDFLDYLDRLSKSIRITFFNIIAINKSSLVALYGHILTLTFVTS